MNRCGADSGSPADHCLNNDAEFLFKNGSYSTESYLMPASHTADGREPARANEPPPDGGAARQPAQAAGPLLRVGGRAAARVPRSQPAPPFPRGHVCAGPHQAAPACPRPHGRRARTDALTRRAGGPRTLRAGRAGGRRRSRRAARRSRTAGAAPRAPRTPRGRERRRR